MTEFLPNCLSPLPRAERRRLQKAVHKTKDKDYARRILAILALADGKPASQVAADLAASRSSVYRWIDWYSEGGLEGLRSLEPGRDKRLPEGAMALVLKVLLACIPSDLGYLRSRWSSELLAIEVNRVLNLSVHASTIRRLMPNLGYVWRRARPTLHLRDPDKARKLQAIEAALEQCSSDQAVFFVDEVDIELNPKIGADWMPRGKQKAVPTPGKNQKRYLASTLHAQTGKIVTVEGTSKNSELFIELLEQLKRTYRRTRKLCLIVDNYIIHKSRKTRAWLRANPKFELIFQPTYSPWVNRIERLWKALHDTVTRNHHCKYLWELMDKVRCFLIKAAPFPGSGHGTAIQS